MHTLEQLRSGALAGARRLDLSCGLTELPHEVFALADTLEVLNLSGNRLSSLPHGLSRLKNLKIVFGSDNPFTELPEVLGDCEALQVVGFKACDIAHVPGAALPPALRWLILTDNAIERLPPELGDRPLMQKLMLAGNRLSALPDGLAGAERLELLRLSANRFGQLPAWLTTLPRLAWLALSGNPLGWSVPTPEPLPQVPWASLQIGAALGEGASGRISRVETPDHAQGLALKLFKGAVTSDGLPEHELAGSLVAGQHPALCTPVAELSAHPQGTPGLLLPLIPPGHVHLAGPPSMESCTRDVYADGWRIGAPQALRLARTMAVAVAHLHQRGVMHGDLYAHNILWKPGSGEAMLSDFGAATLLPVGRPELRRALLALEVRAFGYLLEELVAHAQRGAGDAPVWTVLGDLMRACLQTDPLVRPAMDGVAFALGQVAGDRG